MAGEFIGTMLLFAFSGTRKANLNYANPTPLTVQESRTKIVNTVNLVFVALAFEFSHMAK